MADTFKVEVKDPPQGVAPPHPGGTGSKKSCHDRGVNRLRKFVARPSAGLRIRIHPTLQSEQVCIFEQMMDHLKADLKTFEAICYFQEHTFQKLEIISDRYRPG
jgi:hypothetical protein